MSAEAPAVVLVRGDDAGLVADRLRAVVAELVAGDASGMATEDLSGEDVVVASIVDACQTPPFLADRRVVIVRNVGRYTADQVEPLVAYLSDPMPTSSLVLGAGGGAIATRLLNAVKKAGRVDDTAPPTRARERTSWLTERMAAAGVKLDAKAGAMLLDHLGEDVGRVGAVLSTLEAVYGPGTAVGVADLEPYLGDAGGVAPWDLTDAIDRGDAGAAIVALKRMIGGGRHPFVVMATLQRHVLGLLRLDGSGARDEQDAAKLLGTAPFTAKKALTQARRLGSESIGRAVTLVADADLDLRGLKEWPDELVLEVLVARLCQLSRAARRS